MAWRTDDMLGVLHLLFLSRCGVPEALSMVCGCANLSHLRGITMPLSLWMGGSSVRKGGDRGWKLLAQASQLCRALIETFHVVAQ